MFSFFRKKIKIEKIEAFCEWFIQNNERIASAWKKMNEDKDSLFQVLSEIESELIKVYGTSYRGNVEFEFGLNKELNVMELNLYHLNDKYLIEATTCIATILNEKLKNIWTINTGE